MLRFKSYDFYKTLFATSLLYHTELALAEVTAMSLHLATTALGAGRICTVIVLPL